MDEKREIRNTSCEVTIDNESRTIEGYALLFDTPSTGLPFTEIIERGALEDVIQKSDVFALLNHSQERGILA
ncbi:MAG: HK97 family phage prohead protease, partial [Bacteroidaceae bacterium]